MSIANDDKSPLIDLLTCIVCKVTMKIANEPKDQDVVQYRCEQCGRTELVRLIRRSRDVPLADEMKRRNDQERPR